MPTLAARFPSSCRFLDPPPGLVREGEDFPEGVIELSRGQQVVLGIRDVLLAVELVLKR